MCMYKVYALMKNARELCHAFHSIVHKLKGISILCHIKLKDSIIIRVEVKNVHTYTYFIHALWVLSANPITAILSLNARDESMFIITFYSSCRSIWLLSSTFCPHFIIVLDSVCHFIPFQQLFFLFYFFIRATFCLRIV